MRKAGPAPSDHYPHIPIFRDPGRRSPSKEVTGQVGWHQGWWLYLLTGYSTLLIVGVGLLGCFTQGSCSLPESSRGKRMRQNFFFWGVGGGR